MRKNIAEDLINRDRDGIATLVVMMCGVAGSGKTTYTQSLEKEGFVRLSIDEEIGLVMDDMGWTILLKNMLITQ